MVSRQLRFRDLQERGVVANRATLKNWTDKSEFPVGRLIGPNTRTWTEEEVSAWLESRPTAPKQLFPNKRTGEPLAAPAAAPQEPKPHELERRQRGRPRVKANPEYHPE
jgi:predicted DNA-binding transcriptional regulator AlpA